MRHQPTVFEQIVEQFPWQRFDLHARNHLAERAQRGFTARHHFLALLGGALGGQQGLRELITALGPNGGALRLLGGKAPARTTLADATHTRPAQLFIDLLGELIGHVNRPMRRALRGAVRLIDATHLDLGQRMQRWFGLQDGQVAAKLHVVFDPSAQKPTFFAVTAGNVNDITAAKQMLPIEPGATYVFDLGYYDFAWWAGLLDAGCSFITRLKSNTLLRDTEARPVLPGSCVLSDQTGLLPKRLATARRNPFTQKGREITIQLETGKTLRLFTNDLTSTAEEIAELYKERWQIELFFKWIKQNLRISRFLGCSDNAIRTQIAVAFIAFLLVRLIQSAQPVLYPASTILLLARTHLFVRRHIAQLLDPRSVSPPARLLPAAQLSMALCN